jgi:hypothetical protein
MNAFWKADLLDLWTRDGPLNRTAVLAGANFGQQPKFQGRRRDVIVDLFAVATGDWAARARLAGKVTTQHPSHPNTRAKDHQPSRLTNTRSQPHEFHCE